jgi:hypothetical protein
MSNFDPHISVDHVSSTKDSAYNIKELRFDNKNIKIETPFKILDGKGITEEIAKKISPNVQIPIYETAKFIPARSMKTLFDAVTGENGDWISSLNDFFKIRTSLWNKTNNSLSIIFRNYPLKDTNRFNDKTTLLGNTEYTALLDYVYAASSLFLLVPDIVFDNKNPSFSLKEYLEFIDHSVDLFSQKNNKPIFVPIPIDIDPTRQSEILSHYFSKGYVNIWINFNSKQCDGIYSARLRILDNIIQSIYKDANVVLYCSHLKKEITPVLTQPFSISSDIIPQFAGADIVGVTNNRPAGGSSDKSEEPYQKKGYDSKEEYNAVYQEHTHRIFDSSSYYYYYPGAYPYGNEIQPDIFSTIRSNKEHNNLFNSVQLYDEFNTIRHEIAETQKIKPYLAMKNGISSDPALLNDLINTQTSFSGKSVFVNQIKEFRRRNKN